MLDAPQTIVKQKGRSIMAEVSDELLMRLLAQQPRASRQSAFGFVALLFVLVGVGWWAASNLSFDGVPVDTIAVPTIRALPSRVPPVKRDAFVPVVAQPTVAQPTPTSGLMCDGGKFQVDANGQTWCENATAQTSGDGFWTEEELAVFRATDVAATATSEAFYDASTLPTPAPELVSEMEQKCGDADLVARSPLLELWCADIYGD